MLKTILLIEDNKNQQLLYQQELSREGYNIITAANGTEAVNKVFERMPDIIIMDYFSASRSNTLNLILGKNKKIPIIVNTAFCNYKDAGLSCQIDAIVIKSSDLTELKSKVKELVGNSPGAI